MSNNTYEQLVSKVEELDYIRGPTLDFNVQEEIVKANGHLLAKECECSKNLDRKDYNISLLADFYYELEKQASDISGNSEKFFVSSVPSKFVHKTLNGDKYIDLTPAGEHLFRQIWNCSSNYALSGMEIPLADFSNGGKKLDFACAEFGYEFKRNNSRNHLTANPSLDNTIRVLDKEKHEPSLLVLNTTESAGFTEEYKSVDDKVVGSRNSLRSSGISRIK
jgi:hypothetical protein